MLLCARTSRARFAWVSATAGAIRICVGRAPASAAIRNAGVFVAATARSATRPVLVATSSPLLGASGHCQSHRRAQDNDCLFHGMPVFVLKLPPCIPHACKGHFSSLRTGNKWGKNLLSPGKAPDLD